MEWDNIGWLYLILDFTIENTREMEWDNIGWLYSIQLNNYIKYIS